MNWLKPRTNDLLDNVMTDNKIDPESPMPPSQKRALKSDAKKNFNPNYVRPKKKSKKPYIFGSIAFLIVGLIILMMMPAKGSIRFGLCKTFLELNDPYPQFLEWVSLQESGLAVILDYNRTDAFGARTLNQIRCIFKNDEKTGALYLERVNVNRDAISPLEDKIYIDRFNTGITAILKNPPDLTYPRGMPENIKNYR